jgi:hypothetical protein
MKAKVVPVNTIKAYRGIADVKKTTRETKNRWEDDIRNDRKLKIKIFVVAPCISIISKFF